MNNMWGDKMNTYLIFNIRESFATYYRNRPSILYKMFVDIFNADEDSQDYAKREFDLITKTLDVNNMNEFIKSKFLDDCISKGNLHVINTNDGVKVKVLVNNDYISVSIDNDDIQFISKFYEFSKEFFIINLKEEDYKWIRDLYDVYLVYNG